MQYIINRLKEPSTWAGVAVFFGMFGLDQDMLARITANLPAIVTALASLAAIFAPSRVGQENIVQPDQVQPRQPPSPPAPRATRRTRADGR